MNVIFEYNSRVSKVLDNIDILRRQGKDISLYDARLKNIMNSTSNSMHSVIKTSGKAVQSMQKDMYYTEALKELAVLLDETSEMIELSKISFKCETIKTKLNDNEADTDELYEFLKSLINDAHNIKDDFNISNNTIHEVYQIAYEVIKIELIKHGKSKLLEYIKENDKGIEFINDFVREDLEKIDMKDLSNQFIKVRLNELLKDGLNYADEKLILAILFKTDSRILKFVESRIAELEKKYDETYYKEYNAYEKSDKASREKAKLSEQMRKNKKKKIMNAIFVAYFTFAMIYAKTQRTFENSCTTNNYENINSTYSTISGIEDSTSEMVYDKGSNTVILQEYGEVSSSGQRILTTYDMSDISLDSTKEYTEYDLSSLDGDTKLIDYEDTQESRESYMTVDRVTYSDEPVSKTFDEKRYKTKLALYIGFLSSVSTLDLITIVLTIIDDKKSKKKIKFDEEEIEFYNEEMEMLEENKKDLYAEKEKLRTLYEKMKKELSEEDTLHITRKELERRKADNPEYKRLIERCEDLCDFDDPDDCIECSECIQCKVKSKEFYSVARELND